MESPASPQFHGKDATRHSLTPESDVEDRLPVRSLEPFDRSLKRYFRTPGPDEQDYGLCEVCNSIDFEALFSIAVGDPVSSEEDELPGGGVSLLRFSNFHDLQHTKCSLCRLLRQQAETEDARVVSRVIENQPEAAGYHFDRDEKPEVHLVLAAPNPSQPKSRLGLSNGNRATWHTVVPGHWKRMRPGTPPETTARTHYLSSEYMDYKMFAREIDLCADRDNSRVRSHGTSTIISGLQQIKVIDCTTRRIRPYDGTSDYLTLSYVWGRESSQAPTDPDISELENGQVPTTIEDAINVTLRLGVKYLWVDRYCIDQTDPVRKASQIQGMSAIFQNCWATIVSLAADDSSPLPGVSTPRQRLCIARTVQCDLLGPGEDPEDYMEGSPWNTRGWTFQEAVLSKRLLIFSSMEVFLLCNHGSIHESRTWFSHDQDLQDSAPNLDATHPRIKAEIYGEKDVPNAISVYSKRALTSDMDSLNAFRGYLESVDYTSYWGTIVWPIADDRFCLLAPVSSLDGIAIGLLWKTDAPDVASPTPEKVSNSSVCKVCPSWSWISCRNHVELQYTIENAMQPGMHNWTHREVHVPGVFLESVNGGVISVADLVAQSASARRTTQGHLIPEHNRWLFVRGRVLHYTESIDGENGVENWFCSNWPVLNETEVVYGNSSFDQRTCCQQHREMAARQRFDVAILVYVDCRISDGVYGVYFSAFTKWLTLRLEPDAGNRRGDEGYWHRVGSLDMSFWSTPDLHRLGFKSTAEVGDRNPIINAISRDLREDCHVRTLRLG